MANRTAATLITHFNRLPSLAGNIKSAGDALVQETAEKIAADAASRAPVKSGNLRDSIEPVGSGSEATVVVGAEYGIYVEYGTSRMGAQPFFWPAVEAARAAYNAGWKPIISGSGQRAGSSTITPGKATVARWKAKPR